MGRPRSRTSGPTAEESKGLILKQFDRLRNSIGNLHDRLGELEERIIPILEDRPEPDQTDGESAAGPCPLADELKKLENEVGRATLRIAELNHRIEL